MQADSHAKNLVLRNFSSFFHKKAIDKLFKSLYNVAYPTSYFALVTLKIN